MHRTTRRLVSTLAALAALMLAATLARAQGAGRSLDIDTSIRSAGMGGASNAVFWGGDGDLWANPALLGYHQGIRYQWNTTRLVPDLTNDVFLRSGRLSAAQSGIGVMSGSVDLDYGEATVTDNNGNVIGTFDAFEHATFTGIGISTSSLVRSLAGLEEDATGPLAVGTRLADLAFGYTRKRIHVSFGPGSPAADAVDWGMLARLSPLHEREVAGVPVDVDLAYGHSVIDANHATLDFGIGGLAPLSRITRDGFAVHAGVGVPDAVRARAGGCWGRWLAASFSPLLGASFARDGVDVTTTDGTGRGYNATCTGGEFSLANILTLRTGHYTDLTGDIDGSTSGWGLGFSLGGVIGYRYDHATFPQAKGFDKVSRRGWTAFVDPLALARLRHPARAPRS